MTDRERIISDYIEGYNTFDVDKMIENMDVNIVFENSSNGEIDLELKGLFQFKEQAIKTISYFSKRKQTIKTFKHIGSETEVEIDYYAVLGTDFPNGLKKGDEIQLKGKSIFSFSNNTIIKLVDIS